MTDALRNIGPRTCACGRRGRVENPRAIGFYVWRRYYCRHCDCRWTTVEVRRLAFDGAPILEILRTLVAVSEEGYRRGRPGKRAQQRRAKHPDPKEPVCEPS